jgi:hypothetical protein
LKTETISIKGHEYHSVQSSYQPHDLTYQSFCKTHVSHGNNVLSSIAETNSRGLDAFRFHICDRPFSWTATAWHASHRCDGFQLRNVKAQQVPKAHQALEWQQRWHAEKQDTCSVAVKELVKADLWTNYKVITAKWYRWAKCSEP